MGRASLAMLFCAVLARARALEAPVADGGVEA
jgi:hypothetical protein